MIGLLTQHVHHLAHCHVYICTCISTYMYIHVHAYITGVYILSVDYVCVYQLMMYVYIYDRRIQVYSMCVSYLYIT